MSSTQQDHDTLGTPLLADDQSADQPRSLRQVARSVMLAQRFSRPSVSSKGVPLLQSDALLTILTGRGEDEDQPSESSRQPNVALAARFVSDALAGRSPNTRLASTMGVSGAPVHMDSPLERFIHHWAYGCVLQLIVTLHCILAFFEANPPATAAPSFSWHVGACEAVCIAAYCIDVTCVFWAMGWRHFLDKRWQGVFAVITALALFDWLLYYPGGLLQMWRFSRPLRPLLGVSKVKSLRRLLASILWTIPALVDMSLLLFIAIFFYATLGVQLFNSRQVPDYSLGNDNFDDWTSAALAIYILTTTENYPNVGACLHLSHTFDDHG